MRQRNLSNGGKREVRRAGGDAGGGAAVPSAVPATASDEDIAHLIAFTGKSEDQCRMCLEASGNDRERAAAMLLGLGD